MNLRLIHISVIVEALCWSVEPICAQPSWVPAGNPLWTLQMRDIYADSVTDAIYFCGQMSYDGDNNFTEQGVPFYSNGQWDTIGPLIAQPICMIRWGDTLLLGGVIVFIDSVPFQNCAALVNGQWIPFGDFSSSPNEFRIIDGELYAIGAFEEVDGHVCNGLAKRVAGHWTSVGSMAGLYQNYLSDLLKYNGHLVIAGAVGFDWTSAHGVGILNDTTWEPLGPGIMGGWGQGRSLAIYQGDLYVGGAININDGNAGHGIMRWDGSQFHPVGTGLQGDNNDYSDHCGVAKMVVRNGLLYCAGQFDYAGNVPAKGMATWDGTDWCGFGGDLELPVESFDFYHDTLFVGPHDNAEGIDVECAAKYVGTYPDTCSDGSTSVISSAYAMAEPVLQLEAGHISVQMRVGVERNGQLLDATGRLLDSRFGSAFEFPTTCLPSGVYLVRIAGFRPRRVFVP